MTELPKPEARGPRPRRPIPRKSARARIRKARPRGARPDHRSAVKVANDIWREIIYAGSPCGICPRCERRKWHDAAHCWSKGSKPSMRFLTDNGAPLCRPCHRRVDSDHQAKRDFFEAYLGRQTYARLEAISRMSVKLDMQLVMLDLGEQAASARRQVEAMGYTWPVRPPRE